MKKQFLIWDFPLRLFHWTFAALIFALWFTGEQGTEFVDIHMQLGYAALGLVLFRIFWGFLGPKHARFFHFMPSFSELTAYIKNFNKQTDVQYAGHNPLGSLMVVVMLTLVLTQAISGLFIDDDVFSAGPYNSVVSGETAKLMNAIHHTVFDFILVSIALHIGAIFYYWKMKKQNLILPMLHGKKTSSLASEKDEISSSKILLAVVLAVIVAVVVYWLVVINAPVIEEYYY